MDADERFANAGFWRLGQVGHPEVPRFSRRIAFILRLRRVLRKHADVNWGALSAPLMSARSLS